MNETRQVWKSRPIFISSTFKDMHAERDWLRNYVFPRLAEELRARRHHLEPIDLRLGVETTTAGTEEERELLVLKVCLDEIKRSRPFLLVLLGDRYGWTPPAERIEAAAREQDFAIEEDGKSVTALEIEFGILKEDHEQRQRSLFFFRNPLPYDKMSQGDREHYSDAYSPDLQVRAGFKKLQELKARLEKDPELGTHVYTYTVGWDEQARQITNLKEFGDLVFEKLWQVLDDETREFALQAPPTWEEEERVELAEFIEHRRRDFVGRKDLVFRILSFAHSPSQEGAGWGACITGPPGSGKSALFSELVVQLQEDKDLLILANACGGTQRGSQVDAMLRRWIQDLAALLEIKNPLRDNATPDDVDTAFLSLLIRASASRRVVVLLDALDQFEPTVRGQHLTWLKGRQWPANVRLIATALPGNPAEALAQWGGVDEIDLEPLTRENAQEIGPLVWRRYHRELHPDVLRVLTDKVLPDGTPAYGNPLWLTLALEQLNLLDADDFARAERDFIGSPTEQMHALLLDTAQRMPPDMEGLYGWLLVQNEKVFGKTHARVFVAAFALSRFGWRETDLLEIIPRLAPLLVPNEPVPPLDELSLAALRRGFRSHLIRRGALGQLDFCHAQMRRFVDAHLLSDEEKRRALHGRISDYLEILPPDDPIIPMERMRQLIGERDRLRAARYYASSETTLCTHSEERIGSTWTIAEWIVKGMKRAESRTVMESNINLEWIISWFDDPDLSREELASLSKNFLAGLLDRLRNDTTLMCRLYLSQHICQTLERLTARDKNNIELQSCIATSYLIISIMFTEMGNNIGSIKSCRKALAIYNFLVNIDPDDTRWMRCLALSQITVGRQLKNQGNTSEALSAFRTALAICEGLTALDLSNAEWQGDFGLSLTNISKLLSEQGNQKEALATDRVVLAIYDRLANLDKGNAYWKSRIAETQTQIGVQLSSQNEAAEAMAAFQIAKNIYESMLADDPENVEWQSKLSFTHQNIGLLLSTQGDLGTALESFKSSMVIIKSLIDFDPGNIAWQSALANCYNNLGVVLSDMNDLDRAFNTIHEAHIIHEILISVDPGNVEWQRCLAASYNYMGNLRDRRGDKEGALVEFYASHNIIEQLTKSDPGITEWQNDLASSHNAIGRLQLEQGDQNGAFESFTDALATSQKLSTKDSINPDWQLNLAFSHNNIGLMLKTRHDYAGAITAYQEAIAILDRLVALRPKNLKWQKFLATTHSGMADLLYFTGDNIGALRACTIALAIYEQLAVACPNNDELTNDIFRIKRNIGGLQLEKASNVSVQLSIPTAHAAADPSRAAQLNLEYQQKLAAWYALPWWKRMRTRMPEKPQGI